MADTIRSCRKNQAMNYSWVNDCMWL